MYDGKAITAAVYVVIAATGLITSNLFDNLSNQANDDRWPYPAAYICIIADDRWAANSLAPGPLIITSVCMPCLIIDDPCMGQGIHMLFSYVVIMYVMYVES